MMAAGYILDWGWANHERLHAFESHSQSNATHRGLRRVPENGRFRGASSFVHGVRPRRMLRLLQKQARHQALPPRQASHHAFARTRRKLGLVLRRRRRTRLFLIRIACRGGPLHFLSAESQLPLLRPCALHANPTATQPSAPQAPPRSRPPPERTTSHTPT